MKLFAAGLFLALSANAQAQAPAEPDSIAVSVLKQQRNEQADIVVLLASRLAALERELKAAQEKLASCKPKPEEKK